MNIYVKNCNVKFYPGTETMNITEPKEPETKTADDVIKEPDGVVSTQRTYTLEGFLASKAVVQNGDRVKLPEFTVPAVKMDGENVMTFEKMTIADEAVVIDKEADGSPVLLFIHCLFKSAMDLNDKKDFAQTQLAQYLESAFKKAMNSAGIPADTCGLISNEEMFSKNALEFFKDGRNRIAFGFDEDCSQWYWLKTLYVGNESNAYFCTSNNYGYANNHGASHASIGVRPCFVIRTI